VIIEFKVDEISCVGVISAIYVFSPDSSDTMLRLTDPSEATLTIL